MSARDEQANKNTLASAHVLLQAQKEIAEKHNSIPALRDHHPNGPSAHPGIIQCPCYMGSSIAGEAAQRGTLQHEYLEELLTQPTRAKMLGLTDEERDGTEWAAKYVRQHSHGAICCEERLEYKESEWDDEPTFFGTCDAYSINPKPVLGQKTANLFDLKTGEPHDYEWQMAAYAAMLCQKHQLDEVVVHLMFSKIKDSTPYRIERWKAEQMVKHVLSLRNDPNKQPTPCDYCRWCANAGTCPALVERASTVAAGREDWALEQYHASAITDPAQMSKALKLARCIKEWAEAVEHHAKDMAIKRGEIIPGFAVSKRGGAKEITDARLAFAASGMEIDPFLECCNPRIGDLEKVLKKDGMKKLENCIKRKPDQYFLVTEKE